jgi:hypothetical protein
MKSSRPNHILTVELHRSFLYILFFQEKTLGDISFKLETKIMNLVESPLTRPNYKSVAVPKFAELW